MAAVTVAVCFAVIVGAFVVSALRRRLREGEPGGGDVAASQRHYLAANWAEVEAAARRGGMTPDEIAAVRRNLLGG